jgi:hypothetical protein
MYGQRIAGRSLKAIKTCVDRNESGWQTIENLSSVTAAIERYCERHPEKPRPPKRKPGRRKR